MPSNGSRVTQKQHYDDLTKLGEGLGKSVADLDSKLGAKMDGLLAAVAENRVANAGEFACLQEGLNGLKTRLEGKGGLIDRIDVIDGPTGRLTAAEGKITDLKASDKWWAGMAGLAGTIAAAIAGTLASRR